MPSIASGRVTERWSLLPSWRSPPKSAAVRSSAWIWVPIAPSKTTARRSISSRYGWPGTRGCYLDGGRRPGPGRGIGECLLLEPRVDVRDQARVGREAAAVADGQLHHLKEPRGEPPDHHDDEPRDERQ